MLCSGGASILRRMPAARKAAWTIAVAEGPVSVVADRVVSALVAGAAAVLTWKLSGVAPDSRGHGTHEQFGMDRALEVLRATRTPRDDVAALHQSVAEFAQTDQLADDTTIASIMFGAGEPI